MSSTDAEKFLEKMETDADFRTAFEAGETWDVAWEVVRAAGLEFTEDELHALIISRTADVQSDVGGKADWSPHW